MAPETVDKEIELKFRTVILELENVIAETDKFEVMAWERVATANGVFSGEWEKQIRKHREDEWVRWILKKSGKHRSPQAEQRLLHQKETSYLQALQQITSRDLLPGIMPLLKDFKKNGVRIVAVSTRNHTSSMIERLEIGDFIDGIIDGAAAGELHNELSTVVHDSGAYYEKCIAVIHVQSKLLGGETPLFVVGVGSKERVEGTDWVVEHTGELTYEDLKEQFLKTR